MKTYNKLVRDNIPEIIQKSGKECTYIELQTKNNQEEFLKVKLIEEMSELCLCQNNEDRIEEIADVLEVLDAYMKFYGIDKFDVDSKKLQKKLNKGGFKNFVLLKTVKEETE